MCSTQGAPEPRPSGISEVHNSNKKHADIIYLVTIFGNSTDTNSNENSTTFSKITSMRPQSPPPITPAASGGKEGDRLESSNVNNTLMQYTSSTSFVTRGITADGYHYKNIFVTIPKNAAWSGTISERYAPANISVPVGSTVIWINEDDHQHTITSGHEVSSGNGIDGMPDGKFSSGLLDPGYSYSFTFHDRTEYHYHCALHPWMYGRVTVF